LKQLLEKSNGLLIVEFSNDDEEMYSSKMACPICGMTFEELQPRMFSFNSPFGACETCHGLGIKMDFDPELIIPDKSKAIIDGAIAIYGKMDLSWRLQQLTAVGKQYGFDMFTPISFFNDEQLNILLYGNPKPFTGRWNNGASMHFKEGWEGLIPQSERLYHQTESEYRKQELEKYMRTSDCPACNGKRLKPQVLSVKINKKSIIDITDMSIKDAICFFEKIKLTEKEQEISKQVLKEIKKDYHF
jgi:excinuclease ABC subunit A